jgi:serine/threonine protein kinase/tetratricopeptide (TPR) repeat protein
MRCGAFDLENRVGRGAAGEVWRARYRADDSLAAVKILTLPDGRPPEEAHASFRREVRAQARLDHPSIAFVYDYGLVDQRDADSSDGRLTAGTPYMAMELAEDGSLADTLLPPNWRTCREILLALIDALAYAHAREVLHRDIKPENILRFPEADGLERWKLADFGLAVVPTDDDHPTAWDRRATAGTPEYMSPEQFDGRWREFGPWTDLYQVGCLAFELVTGRLPYEGDSTDEVIQQHIHSPIPSVDPRFDVPDGINTWLRKLLAKSPAERFRRAADAARHLAELTPNSASLSTPLESSDDLSSDSEPISPLEDKRRQLRERQNADRKLSHLYHDPSEDVSARPSPATSEASDESPYRDRPATAADVPATWRRPTPSTRQGAAAIGGLELFALRETPFVDRVDERDRIWAKLREVAHDRRPRGILVEGPPGLGSSRLAEWTVRRSHETGACIPLRTTHAPDNDRAGGLTGLVRDWLDPDGLERGEFAELAHSRLAAYAHPDDEETGNRRDLAAALTELLYPTATDETNPDGPAYHLGSARERFAVIHRFLRRLSSRRQVALWLDDLHLGPRTVSFLEFLFDAIQPPPVFVVATVRTDPPPTAVETYERIDGLLDHDVVESIRLDPLEPEDERELIERALPLTPELTRRIQQRTEGHPLFTLQLLDDWATRRLLEPTNHGFELVDGADDALPASLYDVWHRRIDDAIAVFPDEQSGDAQAALELAAVLGERVDPAEWHAACEHASLSSPPRLVDELVGRGLIVREEGTWRFAHQMLVDVLLDDARQGDRLEYFHRVCAETLAADASAGFQINARRQATHWRHGGRPERAIAPLLDAARQARIDHGEPESASRLLELRRDLLEQCDIDEGDPRWARQWLQEGWIQMYLGDNQRARQLAERARDLTDNDEPDPTCGEANLLLARLSNDAGELGEATNLVDRARQVFDRLDSDEHLARCQRFRGHILGRRQEFEQAEPYFKRARRYYESADDPTGQAWCTWSLARAQFESGQIREAKETAQCLLVRADQLQHPPLQATACNLLGDLARADEKWETAVDYYKRARDVWKDASPNQALVPDLNIALVETQRHNWQRARSHLERLEGELAGFGLETLLPHVDLGLAACAASERDAAGCRSRLDAARRRLQTFEYRDRDLGRLAEQVADKCLETDDIEGARSALTLAVDLWEKFDDAPHQKRLEKRLEDLP